MRFNISQLRDHMRCPQLAYNRHVLRRGPADARVNINLAIGTMFHQYMAARLGGRSHLTIEEQLVLAPNSSVWDEWQKHKLWLPADTWAPEPGEEIRLIEQPLQAGIGHHTLEGTPDSVSLIDGGWWSRQWKTYADDLDDLVEKVEIGWHESVAYPLLIERWLDEIGDTRPYRGTLLGAVQKLPGYRLVADPLTGKKSRKDVTDQDRIDALTFHWISVKPELYARRQEDMTVVADELAWMTPVRNPDACHGMFGGSKCPYWSVCYDGEDIMGPQFVEIEDRYAPKNP